MSQDLLRLTKMASGMNYHFQNESCRTTSYDAWQSLFTGIALGQAKTGTHASRRKTSENVSNPIRPIVGTKFIQFTHNDRKR